MRKVLAAIHFKNILLLIIAFIAFIVITSVLIVGVGNNKYINKDTNKSKIGRASCRERVS